MNIPPWMKRIHSRCRTLLVFDFAAIQLKFSVFFRLNHRAITTALFFAVLLVPLSSSVNLTGQLGFVQKKMPVDALEGGVIEEIYVVNGQYVKQGDVLAKLIEPRLDAELTSLLNGAAARLCRLTKYEQLLSGSDFQIHEGYDLIPETVLATYCDDEQLVARGLLRNFSQKKLGLEKQISQTRNDVTVLENSLRDEHRRVAIQTSLYQKRQELVDQSFYSASALLEQESLLISARQNLAAKTMELSDKRSRLLDLLRQKLDLDADFQERNRMEYTALRSEFEAQYASLRASLRFNKTLTMTASQNGYVNQLKKARVGQLLSPRETLLEIVPSSEDMVVIATYKPADHTNISVGQSASLRLITHNQSIAPEFKGQVMSVSPDIKQDSPLDTPSYEAVISFDCNADCRKQHLLAAGVPVDVYVLGGKRSLLSYLMNSLYRVGSTALSEPN